MLGLEVTHGADSRRGVFFKSQGKHIRAARDCDREKGSLFQVDLPSNCVWRESMVWRKTKQ